MVPRTIRVLLIVEITDRYVVLETAKYFANRFILHVNQWTREAEGLSRIAMSKGGPCD